MTDLVSNALPKRRRAAEYVRMSRDQQKYSIANQRTAIAEYAAFHEIEVIRTYADEGKIRQVILVLTEQSIRNARGNSWSIQNIIDVLSCEKYTGTFVYNCSSERMRKRRIYYPPSKWLRVKDANPPIIDHRTFAEAQCRLGEAWALTDVDMLNYLTPGAPLGTSM